MILAAHQPNLMPWFPFFYKMHKADIFIIMTHCQYEKNGYQNRFNVRGKWITIPVDGGTCDIKDKSYTNGYKLSEVNIPLILSLAKMLNIDTDKIHSDFPTKAESTERIIELCKFYGADQYLTNPEATTKYLDAEKVIDAGIDIIPCVMPKQFNKSIFEILEECGVEGARKILNKTFVHEKI